MNKRNSLIAICLVLTCVIAGCSRTKTVKTKETKQFTKSILESNEKIKSLKFYFTRPHLNAEMIYEGDLEDIDFMQNIGGYSCVLYYDTLYDKAYLVKDGGLDEVGIDFARYIDSLLENTNITAHIEDSSILELFQSYGWTLDYKVNKLKTNLEDMNVLSEFNPTQYYFAYNNELSKDIGLDIRSK